MRSLKYLLLIVLTIMIVSCGDDDETTTQSISIWSISPESGTIGSKVTITGQGFELDKNLVEVTFAGNVVAKIDTIINSQPMKITCVVPQGAQTGKISVKVGNLTAISSQVFTLINLDNNNLQPMTKGSFWVYSKSELDSNNNIIVANPQIDSIAITGTKMQSNKNVNIFTNYTLISGVYQNGTENYYYSENKNLYAHSSWFADLLNFGASGFSLPFTVPDGFYKIMDPIESNWEILTKQFENEAMSFGVVNGTLTIKGYNLGYDNLVTNKYSFNNSYKMKIEFSFVGKITVQTLDFNLNLTRNMYFWYHQDDGKVGIKLESTLINVPGLLRNWVSGYDYKLINYNVE